MNGQNVTPLAEAPAPSGENLHPGRMQGILSIVSAVISLGFFPLIFGALGIVLGAISHRKGEKTLGLVGIILSAVFMVIGFIVGAAAYLWVTKGAAAIMLGF